MRLWGSIFLLIFLIYERKIYFKASAEDGFVSTEGVHFMLNGIPFYANGFNAYWLMYLASDKSQRNKVSSAFEEAANHGLSIARTWAFGDGGYFSLQYSPGSYNEQMFQASFHSLFVTFSLLGNMYQYIMETNLINLKIHSTFCVA